MRDDQGVRKMCGRLEGRGQGYMDRPGVIVFLLRASEFFAEDGGECTRYIY